MELNQEEIDLLDRYLKEDLTAEELRGFQSRMRDPAFSDAVKSYLETISVVEEAGRLELRQVFASTHSDLASSNELQDYKPSFRKKGGGSTGLITTFIIAIAVVAGYLFFSGKFHNAKLPDVFPTEDKVDTVFHYRVKTDTIITVRTDTVVKKTYRRVTKVDTVYQMPSSSRVDSAAREK